MGRQSRPVQSFVILTHVLVWISLLGQRIEQHRQRRRLELIWMEDSRDNAAIASKSTISNSVRFERFEGSRKSSMETFPTRMPMYIYIPICTHPFFSSLWARPIRYISSVLSSFSLVEQPSYKKNRSSCNSIAAATSAYNSLFHCFIISSIQTLFIMPVWKRFDIRPGRAYNAIYS